MIRIERGAAQPLPNFWNHIHFHPTDAIEDDWGRAILDRVAADRAARTVRLYAMLEDIVSLDADGRLQYDFSLNDQRLDYLLSKGFSIFLSYNFMPPCIAADAGLRSSMSKNRTRYKGKMITVSPPKDYALWEEVCRRYTEHLLERYGEKTVEGFRLQCFNEPDLPAFFMTDLGEGEETDRVRLSEYLRLYEHFARGVRAADERLKVGGPSVAWSFRFFEGFLRTVKEKGLPLDFVSIHTYGTDYRFLNDGSCPFDAQTVPRKIGRYHRILREVFPEGRELIVDEWGASAQGFFNMEECPALMLRERSDYAAYYGKMIAGVVEAGLPLDRMLICLSGQHEMVRDFSGFRNFFTLHRIRKPIYNAYCLAARMRAARLNVCGARENLTVLASGDARGEAVLLAYASPHFDEALPRLEETILLPARPGRVRVRVWVIDEEHTNPYALSQREGWEEPFSPAQLERLRAEGELTPFGEWDASGDDLCISISLTNNALALIESEALGD